MKLKVLFVDDEPEILDGYKRIFFKYRNDWEQFFAISGQDALKIIEENNVEVVVSDMRMPGMDGNELLQKIRELNPEILRIILSGHQNEFKIIKSLSSAHQFLTKPCEPEKLSQTIKNAHNLRLLVENKKTLDFVKGINRLPSLPEVYIELEKELNKQDASFSNIENIIVRDPALTAKILQTVNSGFFGIPRQISNLLDALNFLGTNLVKSIILYLETFSSNNFNGDSAKHIKEISQHSFRVAEISRIICKSEKLSKSETDDIFIAGILHDVGKLILSNNNGYFEEVNQKIQLSKISWQEAERELYGFTHSGVGAYLLGIWGLPKQVIQAVAFHHNPAEIQCDEFCSADILNIANGLSHYKEQDLKINKLDINHEHILKHYSEEKINKWWKEINRKD